MKAFSIVGLTGSGKTTVAEHLIAEFVKRGYTVGTVKEIHFDAFAMDTEGKNTWRHRQAGADTVTARSRKETDILYRGHVDIYEVLSHYTQDIVLMEGVRDAVVPVISCSAEDALPEITPLTMAVSGRFANSREGLYEGVPVINGVTEPARLCDLVLEKTPELMPDMDVECCGACGTDCRGFLAKCLRGEAEPGDCVLSKGGVSLKIDGAEAPMVPFVKRILRNEIMGLVTELKGYRKGSVIEVRIEPEK